MKGKNGTGETTRRQKQSWPKNRATACFTSGGGSQQQIVAPSTFKPFEKNSLLTWGLGQGRTWGWSRMTPRGLGLSGRGQAGGHMPTKANPCTPVGWFRGLGHTQDHIPTGWGKRGVHTGAMQQHGVVDVRRKQGRRGAGGGVWKCNARNDNTPPTQNVREKETHRRGKRNSLDLKRAAGNLKSPAMGFGLEMGTRTVCMLCRGPTG